MWIEDVWIVIKFVLVNVQEWKYSKQSGKKKSCRISYKQTIETVENSGLSDVLSITSSSFEENEVINANFFTRWH